MSFPPRQPHCRMAIGMEYDANLVFFIYTAKIIADFFLLDIFGIYATFPKQCAVTTEKTHYTLWFARRPHSQQAVPPAPSLPPQTAICGGK